MTKTFDEVRFGSEFISSSITGGTGAAHSRRAVGSFFEQVKIHD
jgi:hypothetical protein